MAWRAALLGLFGRGRVPSPAAGASIEPGPAPEGYRIFTEAYDSEVALGNIDSILGPLGEADRKLFESAKQAFAVELAEWIVGAEARVLPWRDRLARLMPRPERERICITLLLDLSGSMRGQRILMAIAVLKVLAPVPQALGIQFEILGFTTATWKGGRAREAWQKNGRPSWPGRLAELVHIVIADAGREESARLANLEALLRPDLLKENIDGEAVQWACSRLMARRAATRALVVISDGAPVDDSTLAANDGEYLARHLDEVVATIGREGKIALFGLGIDFRSERFYPSSRRATTLDELFDAVLCIFSDILVEHDPANDAGGDRPRGS